MGNRVRWGDGIQPREREDPLAWMDRGNNDDNDGGGDGPNNPPAGSAIRSGSTFRSGSTIRIHPPANPPSSVLVQPPHRLSGGVRNIPPAPSSVLSQARQSERLRSGLSRLHQLASRASGSAQEVLSRSQQDNEAQDHIRQAQERMRRERSRIEQIERETRMQLERTRRLAEQERARYEQDVSTVRMLTQAWRETHKGVSGECMLLLKVLCYKFPILDQFSAPYKRQSSQRRSIDQGKVGKVSNFIPSASTTVPRSFECSSSNLWSINYSQRRERKISSADGGCAKKSAETGYDYALGTGESSIDDYEGE